MPNWKNKTNTAKTHHQLPSTIGRHCVINQFMFVCWAGEFYFALFKQKMGWKIVQTKIRSEGDVGEFRLILELLWMADKLPDFNFIYPVSCFSSCWSSIHVCLCACAYLKCRFFLITTGDTNQTLTEIYQKPVTWARTDWTKMCFNGAFVSFT